MSKKNSTFNFETSLEQLSQLVNKMEQGNLPLEQSLQYFEEGVHIIQACQQALQKAEQKIQMLTKEGNEALSAFTTNKDKDHDSEF